MTKSIETNTLQILVSLTCVNQFKTISYRISKSEKELLLFCYCKNEKSQGTLPKLTSRKTFLIHKSFSRLKSQYANTKRESFCIYKF